MKKKLILHCYLSPGDIVMLTAALRDLHILYPNKFITDVRTTCIELWENNPYITKLEDNDKEVMHIQCNYPLINSSNTKAYHFIHGFIQDLKNKLNLPKLEPTQFKGDIHLSKDEKSWISQIHEMTGEDTKFWILNAGIKQDYTAKGWVLNRFQEVINHFKNKIIFVQVGQKDHIHIPLQYTINLIGKTDLRQMVRLMYHADGVICPVTFHMHLAAAVETKPGRLLHRPCVVIAGGREGTQWEQYPTHQYLHTVGALKCCQHGGCWKSRVMPLYDGDEKDKSLCVQPVQIPTGEIVPKCMDIIKTSDVIAAVEKYLYFDNQSNNKCSCGKCKYGENK